jgi:hypothetical protein
VGAVLLGGLIGKPWGYYGRMSYFAVPPALLLVALGLSAWMDARRGRVRVTAVAGLYAISIGVSMIGFPSGSLAAAFKGGSFGVTPHTYAESGRIFRRVAAAADLQRPSILTPDVGGLALCCDEFRVVDLAMLSNRRLAHHGPGALAEVLDSESPDMIEAHWDWASAGNLYELPTFRARYVPAFVGGTKLWIRSDAARTIESKGRGCWLTAGRDEVRQALRAHRYANHDLPADRSAFERSPRVLALEDDAAVASLCR